jgi:hypothetical protein
MDRMFDAAPLDSHCIPTKRRRFADQSAVTISYAADDSMRARIHMYARLDNLVEGRTWTR